MPLYANTNMIAAVDAAFPTVQPLRELLINSGFILLCRVGDGEHWTRGPRRVILAYKGETTDAEPMGLKYATLVPFGSTWTISLD